MSTQPQTTTPTHGLTDKQLKWSYWYVTHKLLLRRLLVIFLIVLSVFLWFYVIWQLTFYAIEYEVEFNQIRNMMFDEPLALKQLESLKPQKLQFSAINMIAGENGCHDYYVMVKNLNLNWLAVFDYQFLTPEGKTDIKSGFVLPGEEKYLMDLGIESSKVEVKITNLKWQKIINFSVKKQDRFRFEVFDKKYERAGKSIDPNIATFKITNNSAYSYWDVGVQVFLINKGQVVGVNYIVLDQFKSGATKDLELFWNNRLPRVDVIQVIPEINYLDDNNIMSPDSPVGEFR